MQLHRDKNKSLLFPLTDLPISTNYSSDKLIKDSDQGSYLENEDLPDIYSSIIDEEYLSNLTGVKDLTRVEYISLQIDTTFQSILGLPDILINLKHLVLDNSKISSIRDLGVGLNTLTSLSLTGCGLEDIDGIGVLSSLQELSLSENQISNISPLMMHESLEVLNLTGNLIGDISFAYDLATCPRIRSLFLSQNPVEKAPYYRQVVPNLISSLEMLDGLPVPNDERNVSSSKIEEFSNYLTKLEEEKERNEKKLSYLSSNLNSSFQSSSVQNNPNNLKEIDASSDLTHGSSVVLAGNMAMAMRRRRHNSSNNSSIRNDDEEEKEFESALDVLDKVLKNDTRYYKNTNGDQVLNDFYYKEGDITNIFLNEVTSPDKTKKNLSFSSPPALSSSISSSNTTNSSSPPQMNGSRPSSASFGHRFIRPSSREKEGLDNHGNLVSPLWSEESVLKRISESKRFINNNTNNSLFLKSPNSPHGIGMMSRNEEEFEELEVSNLEEDDRNGKKSKKMEKILLKYPLKNNRELETKDNDSDSEDDLKFFHEERKKLLSRDKRRDNQQNISVPSSSNNASSSSSRVSEALGFNLADSLAAIDQWVKEDTDSESDKDDYQSSLPSSYRSSRNNSGSGLDFDSDLRNSNIILSREDIFQMYSSTQVPPPRPNSKSLKTRLNPLNYDATSEFSSAQNSRKSSISSTSSCEDIIATPKNNSKNFSKGDIPSEKSNENENTISSPILLPKTSTSQPNSSKRSGKLGIVLTSSSVSVTSSTPSTNNSTPLLQSTTSPTAVKSKSTLINKIAKSTSSLDPAKTSTKGNFHLFFVEILILI